MYKASAAAVASSITDAPGGIRIFAFLQIRIGELSGEQLAMRGLALRNKIQIIAVNREIDDSIEKVHDFRPAILCPHAAIGCL